MTDNRALVERLKSWTTDWDGSKMVPGEVPRDGLHCDDIDAAADALTAALDRIEALEADIKEMRDSVAELEGFGRDWPSHGNI